MYTRMKFMSKDSALDEFLKIYQFDDDAIVGHFINGGDALAITLEQTKAFKKFKNLKICKLKNPKDIRTHFVILVAPFSKGVVAKFWEKQYYELNRQYENLFAEVKALTEKY